MSGPKVDILGMGGFIDKKVIIMEALCRLSLCITLATLSGHALSADSICPQTYGPVSYEFWQYPVQAPPGWSTMTAKQGSAGTNKFQALVGANWEKQLAAQTSARFTCTYATAHGYQGVKDSTGGFGVFNYSKAVSAKCQPAYPQNWRSGGVFVDKNRKPLYEIMSCGDRVRQIDPQACKLVCG